MAIFSDFGLVRLIAFFGIFALMALLQTLFPRRQPLRDSLRRWPANLALAVLNSVMLKLLAGLAVPIAAVATAQWARDHGYGLLHHVELSYALEAIVSLVLLDLAIYGQHVAAHKIPLLWRLHRVHHADIDFDVTTALRFHPIEILLSMLWKMLLVILIGPQPEIVILFEIILNGCAMFNHSNLALPAGLDRALRLVLVTPDMHRVHHSVHRAEQDSNYGFNISLWDRLFATYTPQPAEGQKSMRIGLADHQDSAPSSLVWALALPFRKK
jgi:sterol desaturase/sphingolipid hydroxylase (fatty acid hydroxylase superfamily)